MKICNACHQELPYDSFYKDTSKRDGLKTICKHCFKSKTRVCLHCGQTKANTEFRLESKLCKDCAAFFKRCPACEKIKPVSQFHTNPAQTDGYHPHCVKCRKVWLKTYRKTEEGKERLKNQREKYYITDEYIAARQKYRNSNKFKIRDRHYQRKYRKQNPNRRVAYGNNRRSRVMNAEGTFTRSEFELLCEAAGYRCVCCGKHRDETPEGYLSADHIIPLSKGGANTIDNIQPLCKSCNSTKHDKIIDFRPESLRNFAPLEGD